MKYVVPKSLFMHKAKIVLAGCGGNGSQMLSGLARMHVSLKALGYHGFDVEVYDGDAVSAANIGRQLFSASDIGRNKAEVLVTRVNNFFGLTWKAHPVMLDSSQQAMQHLEILISAVDSARERCILSKVKADHWLDLGNENSSGQVILGTPQNQRAHNSETVEWLPTVLDLYPEMKTKKERNQGPSCSMADALKKQDLFINQMVSTAALQIIWTMFRRKSLTEHGAFINLATMSMRPLPVDPTVWKRMMQDTGTLSFSQNAHARAA